VIFQPPGGEVRAKEPGPGEEEAWEECGKLGRCFLRRGEGFRRQRRGE
jgi:hypothetical protein